MTRCEFLTYTKSKSCAACTGWHCTVMGRKKKIGDTTICNSDELRLLCTRYITVYPQPVEEASPIENPTYEDLKEVQGIATIELKPRSKPVFDPTTPPPQPKLCPYLGPPPPGVQTCCGMYCHANNESLRTGSQCKSRPTWLECRHKGSADKRSDKRLARS